MSTALLIDLDNTLYDFAGFFSPSFRAMLHVISKRTGIEEDKIAEDFKSVYRCHGTIEYRFSVQELFCLRNRTSAEIDDLVSLATLAFTRARRNRLRLYPGVAETLVLLASSGVKLVAVTNAPFYLAYHRLSQLGILKYFSSLACWKGASIPSDYETHIHREQKAQGYLSRLGIEVLLFPKTALKPSSTMFETLKAKLSGFDHYIIGDSLKRDLTPASTLGITTIWARYGTIIDEKNYRTMLSVTPVENVTDYETESVLRFRPDFVVDRFSEILDIVPYSRQFDLFEDAS